MVFLLVLIIFLLILLIFSTSKLQFKIKKFEYSLIKKEQPFPFEEERRLFYVALTRTKTCVYLLTPKYTPSRFVTEIKKENNVEILRG